MKGNLNLKGVLHLKEVFGSERGPLFERDLSLERGLRR